MTLFWSHERRIYCSTVKDIQWLFLSVSELDKKCCLMVDFMYKYTVHCNEKNISSDVSLWRLTYRETLTWKQNTQVFGHFCINDRGFDRRSHHHFWVFQNATKLMHFNFVAREDHPPRRSLSNHLAMNFVDNLCHEGMRFLGSRMSYCLYYYIFPVFMDDYICSSSINSILSHNIRFEYSISLYALPFSV